MKKRKSQNKHAQGGMPMEPTRSPYANSDSSEEMTFEPLAKTNILRIVGIFFTIINQHA